MCSINCGRQRTPLPGHLLHRQCFLAPPRPATAVQADTCRLVLLAGLITMLLPLALMCFFDDDNTLGLLSESLQCVCFPCERSAGVPESFPVAKPSRCAAAHQLILPQSRSEAAASSAAADKMFLPSPAGRT